MIRSVAHSRLRTPALAVVALAMLVAGCGASRTTTTTRPPTSAPVAPSASPKPRPESVAMAAFVKRVTSGSFSYRVGFKGDVVASADRLPIVGSMDVSGADFASSFTYDFSRDYRDVGKIRVQVRGVNGKGYVKSGSSAWRSIKGFDAADSYVPFKTVRTTGDLRYLGPVDIGGRTYHRIGIAGALLLHPNTIPGRLQKEKLDELTLEVVIDDAGRPKRGSWRMRAQGRVGPASGQLQRIVYELDLTFSKVGSKLPIRRP